LGVELRVKGSNLQLVPILSRSAKGDDPVRPSKLPPGTGSHRWVANLVWSEKDHAVMQRKGRELPGAQVAKRNGIAQNET